MTILKELIENMIYDYLEEYYEDDLVESIFEEVSEDTWEAIQEAILNELSPELLQRYKNKAKQSIDDLERDEYAAGARSRNASRLANRATKGGFVFDKKGKKKKLTMRDYNKATNDANKFGVQQVKLQSKIKSRSAGVERADFRTLSGDDFQKKYNMTKTEWKSKNK